MTTGRQRSGADVDSLAFVRKRDERVVPFDVAEIASAVSRAGVAVGEPDEAFARDVATVVELALRRVVEQRRAAGEETPEPHIEEIQDHVERALIELGRPRLAKAYILYRDRRARAREALELRVDEAPSAVGERDVRVLEAERSGPWSKVRIAAALVEEVDLPRQIADDLAQRVEERVFATGLTSVSTGLIRALVDNELVALGLTEALERHEPVSVPSHDLRRALGGEGEQVFRARAGAPSEEPIGLGPAVGAEILRRHALRDVLDPRSRELHLCGDLHVEDLGAPELFLTLGIPAELAAADGQGEGAFALLEPTARLARSVARGVVLEDIGALTGDLARATRARSALGLGGWLRALAGIAAASGRRIDLQSPGSRHGVARARLLEEIAALEVGRFTPRLVIDELELEELGAESADARSSLGRLVARGRVLVTWSSETQRFAAPGAHRGPRERGVVACGGAVAIHLPRLARRAGPWREERLMEELFGLLSCAVEACRSLQRFQTECSHLRPMRMRPKLSYALVPVGLREALRVLGDGDIDPEQGARLLGLMVEAAQRFPGPGSPPIHLTTQFGERAASRFAHIDADRARGGSPRQRLLFSGADAVGGPGEQPYSEGLRLDPLTRWRSGEPEAELSRTVPCGLLWPAPEADTNEPTALDRFRASRERRRSSDSSALLPLEGPPSNLRLLRDREPETTSADV